MKLFELFTNDKTYLCQTLEMSFKKNIHYLQSPVHTNCL